MSFKINKFSIVLFDRPQPIYRPGDVVIGEVVVQLDGQLELNQLIIRLKGEAECHWFESGSHKFKDKDGRIKHARSGNIGIREVRSCHPCVRLKCCPGDASTTTLETGQHNIGFSFQLPESHLPSSFEGAYGHIRYRIKANITNTKLITTQSLTIVSPAFVSIQELSESIETSKQKKIGFFGSQTVSMECQLQRIGYTHHIGTTIPITVSVDNQSKKSMKVKAFLRQDVVFKAQLYTRETTDKLVRVVGTTVQPQSQQTQDIKLLVPIGTPVVNNSCPNISILYTIVVTLDIPGSFDLRCQMPVILTNERLPFENS